MIARIAFYALLLAAAGLVIGVQLDRQTIKDPQLAVLVPAPLRAEAQERLVEIHLAMQDGEQAAQEGRVLVARRPLPARHLMLDASAAAMDGQGPSALAAMEVASTRGWREPLPPVLVAQAALLSGNAEVAADRMTALLTQPVEGETIGPIMAALLAMPEGRQAMALRLAGPGYWHDAFLRMAPSAARPQDVAATLVAARDQGAAITCPVMERIAGQLARKGAPDAAAMLEGDCTP